MGASGRLERLYHCCPSLGQPHAGLAGSSGEAEGLGAAWGEFYSRGLLDNWLQKEAPSSAREAVAVTRG